MKAKKAVALKYEHQNDAAPRVVAKGAGEVADAILRLAQQSNVIVQQNTELTDALMQLKVDSVIPEELFAVVAEVLAVVYQGRQPS